jgi:hypothetical protein
MSWPAKPSRDAGGRFAAPGQQDGGEGDTDALRAVRNVSVLDLTPVNGPPPAASQGSGEVRAGIMALTWSERLERN